VNAHIKSVNLLFFDGERKTDVPRKEIRRPIPYEIDEEIQVDTDDSTLFTDGRIIGIFGNNQLKVAVYESKTIEIVPSTRIRRYLLDDETDEG
jgi:hypothetical protein